jgi:exopolyphosphatase/guanosine-5'-triphosphate,3'-diphosphate pyrophosphatase
LSEEAQDRALAALRRFRLLTRQMGVGRTRVVATAAVRDAANGAAFLDRVREIGFEPEVLSGEEEGHHGRQGVLSGIPDADGIVGDLGGGSLELVDVAAAGAAAASRCRSACCASAPIREGRGARSPKLAKALDEGGFRQARRGRPFYLVGGSWRALAGSTCSRPAIRCRSPPI